MSKKESFNALISSIQEAFLEVNKMSELQHLDMLKNYFDDKNKPVCIEINHPYYDDYGNIQYRPISIPKLCLVPITSLKLSEVSVDFKVKLSGKIKLKEQNMKSDLDDLSAEEENSIISYLPEHFQVKKSKEGSYANISLKFLSADPPEGLMKICDEFEKII